MNRAAMAGFDDVAGAAEVLSHGGLVAFPTETVYGLGADAGNESAVMRIFEVKGRPAGHPLIVHLGDAELLDVWAEDLPPTARILADAFWPGPLTMVLRRSARVLDVVTGARSTVGLRVPDHPVALALLREFGGGVAAPSANRFGQVSPTTAEHVRADLGDEVDFVLDGGPCAVGVESTIIDLTGTEPEVLRPGGVGFDRLAEVLGRPIGLWLGDREVAAPGTLASHYSPAASLELFEAEELGDVVRRATHLAGRDVRVGVLSPCVVDGLPPGVVELEPAGLPEEYARLVYSRLRQADRLGLNVLLTVLPEPLGVGIAVRDRLARAATREGRTNA